MVGRERGFRVLQAMQGNSRTISVCASINCCVLLQCLEESQASSSFTMRDDHHHHLNQGRGKKGEGDACLLRLLGTKGHVQEGKVRGGLAWLKYRSRFTSRNCKAGHSLNCTRKQRY